MGYLIDSKPCWKVQQWKTVIQSLLSCLRDVAHTSALVDVTLEYVIKVNNETTVVYIEIWLVEQGWTYVSNSMPCTKMTIAYDNGSCQTLSGVVLISHTILFLLGGKQLHVTWTFRTFKVLEFSYCASNLITIPKLCIHLDFIMIFGSILSDDA